MEKVSDPFMDQTEVENLSVNEIENQTTNKSMQEVTDPLMDQNKDLKDLLRY